MDNLTCDFSDLKQKMMLKFFGKKVNITRMEENNHPLKEWYGGH